MAKSKILWCLLGVNIAMFVGLVLPYVRQSTASAQGVMRPADYTLIPGDISGGDRGVVYILDSSNRLLSAITFEDSTGRIEVMPEQDLDRVFQEAGAGANPRRRR